MKQALALVGLLLAAPAAGGADNPCFECHEAMDRAWLTGKASAPHVQATRPEYFEVLVEDAKREPGSKPGPEGGES